MLGERLQRYLVDDVFIAHPDNINLVTDDKNYGVFTSPLIANPLIGRLIKYEVYTFLISLPALSILAGFLPIEFNIFPVLIFVMLLPVAEAIRARSQRIGGELTRVTAYYKVIKSRSNRDRSHWQLTVRYTYISAQGNQVKHLHRAKKRELEYIYGTPRLILLLPGLKSDHHRSLEAQIERDFETLIQTMKPKVIVIYANSPLYRQLL